MKRRLLLAAFGSAALRAAVAERAAQPAWPDRAIRLVVPFAPGGTTDLIARIVGERMARHLGQPVIIDNRAGAGGALGAEAVARAPADGCTLGMATQSTHAANAAINPKATLDPLSDFTPISMLALVPGVLAVHPSTRVETMPELIALARSRPGGLCYGTPGIGSLGHLLMVRFEARHRIDLLHVPYRGGTALLADALAGRLQVIGDHLPSALPHLLAGRLHPLGVMAGERVPLLSDVPSFAELGMGEIGRPAWFGLVAPAATPAAVVERLNDVVHRVMREPGVVSALARTGSKPAPGTPDEFARAIGATLQAFRDLAAAHGIAAS
jgi:tripartite-type tricarboxylate transporter receptor subunit TctC